MTDKNQYSEYIPVDLNQYVPGKYYYALGRNYYIDYNETPRTVAYYILHPEQFDIIDLKYGWKPDVYYKTVYDKTYGGQKYILSSEVDPEDGVEYGYINVDSKKEVLNQLKNPSLYNFDTQTYDG
jgi:hypothetical protein